MPRLEAVEAVCEATNPQAESAFQLLNQLVDKSFVVAENGPGNVVRYRLFKTLQSYAVERLEESKQTSLVCSRHAHYYCQFAQEAVPQLRGDQQKLWLDRLNREQENILAALAWCDIEPDMLHVGLQIAVALWRFWKICGFVSEGRQWLERMLKRPDLVPALLRIEAMIRAGNLACDQGDYQVATSLLESALALAREIGDKRSIAFALSNLGRIAREQSNSQIANERCEESLQLYQELADKPGIAVSLLTLGTASRQQRDYGQAHLSYEQSLALFQEIGDREMSATVYANLGLCLEEQGNYVAAYTFFTQGLALCRELGDRRRTATALTNLGRVAQHRGSYEQATDLYQEGLALYQTVGIKKGIASTLEAIAEVACLQKTFEHALRLFASAEALREHLNIHLSSNQCERHNHWMTLLSHELDEEVRQRVWLEGKMTPPHSYTSS